MTYLTAQSQNRLHSSQLPLQTACLLSLILEFKTKASLPSADPTAINYAVCHPEPPANETEEDEGENNTPRQHNQRMN